MHTIKIDECDRQLILLAMAKLAEQRPGFEYALREASKLFPCGEELFNDYLSIEVNAILAAMSTIGEPK